MAEPTRDDELMTAVGNCLADWSLVEMSMTFLFIAISRTPREKALALFDGIISFDVRLGILDRLMALERIDELEAETWVRMSKRLGKLYKKRHEVAHFGRGYSAGHPIIAPFLTYERVVRAKSKFLRLAEVAERSKKFQEACKAMGWFKAQAEFRNPARSIAKNTNPQPVLAEPPLVAQLRASAAQILEERKHNPRSTRPESEGDE